WEAAEVVLRLHARHSAIEPVSLNTCLRTPAEHGSATTITHAGPHRYSRAVTALVFAPECYRTASAARPAARIAAAGASRPVISLTWPVAWCSSSSNPPATADPARA